MNLERPDKIFSGFRIATMADSGLSYGWIEGQTIGVAGGQILWLAPEDQVPDFGDGILKVDGKNNLLTPGLIDCHTHLVYGGNRASEWELRQSGRSYEEIAAAGGGILSTVRQTRSAHEDDLLVAAVNRAIGLVAEGVTTLEIKSGYGLEIETESRMLRVARELENQLPLSVHTTFLGAHALPEEFAGRGDDYIQLVCNEMLAAVRPLCSSVDVFCESIAFDIDQTRRVLESAVDAGLQIKIHAEQLSRTGAAVLAAEMGAVSADHLEYLSAADCEILARFGTVATLLPGAFYCLQETQKPPVAALRANGVPIAVATDHNPGSSPVFSLLLAGNLAVQLYGLSPEEAFAGMTINAARALGIAASVGSIEAGKTADFAVWDVESPAEIIYGIGHNPCRQVFKAGEATVRLDDQG